MPVLLPCRQKGMSDTAHSPVQCWHLMFFIWNPVFWKSTRHYWISLQSIISLQRRKNTQKVCLSVCLYVLTNETNSFHSNCLFKLQFQTNGNSKLDAIIPENETKVLAKALQTYGKGVRSRFTGTKLLPSLGHQGHRSLSLPPILFNTWAFNKWPPCPLRSFPPWLWNPGQTSPEVQKGYQWPHKKDLCPPKKVFLSNKKEIWHLNLFVCYLVGPVSANNGASVWVRYTGLLNKKHHMNADNELIIIFIVVVIIINVLFCVCVFFKICLRNYSE